MSVNAVEPLTGLLIAHVALIRALDRSGVIDKAEYAADLERWIERQPPETQDLDRYQTLRILIGNISGDLRSLQ